MKYRELHPWDVSATEAVLIQKSLSGKNRIEPFIGEPHLIAGADVSFNKYSPTVYASFVVLRAPELRVVARADAIVDVQFPYVPGLLSFREIPPLLEAWQTLDLEPDVIVFDGQGIAHPRRVGIAVHMGLLLDKPTISCAKSRLTGQYKEPGPRAGDREALFDRGEEIGCVLRTKDNVKPLFVSPGHRMDLESSIRILMHTVRGYRIPEPTRQAHLYVNELRRMITGRRADQLEIDLRPR